MTPGAYAFIAFFVILLGWIAWEIIKAPDGWQDRDGWHSGAGVDEWEDGV